MNMNLGKDFLCESEVEIYIEGITGMDLIRTVSVSDIRQDISTRVHNGINSMAIVKFGISQNCTM